MTRERALSLPENDWRSRDADFQEPNLSRNLELVELLRKIGAPHGKAPGEVALAWVLSNPAVTAAIVGLRRADQVHGTAGAMDFRLTAAEVAQLASFMS
jgi:aryl-alcohol dehydrogenase-like predicted oxidoreductase